MLLLAVATLCAHILVLHEIGDEQRRSLVSDILQFVLGLGATFACAQAGRRSCAYSKKVWYLTAIALALYTTGQGIVTYYNDFAHAEFFSPWISDQFFFFWVLPLVVAALIDRWSERTLDWALLLDAGQVLLVALALHLAVFALAGTAGSNDFLWLNWRLRLIRDGLVLAALASKILLSTVPSTRSLFGRIAGFFTAYTLADGIFLYAEAAFSNHIGTYLDLLWSVPRVLLIAAAVTWRDVVIPEEQRNRRTRWQTIPLHIASILGPLFLVIIAIPMSRGMPVTATLLVLVSFALSGTRFLLTQDRQERALAEVRSSRDLLQAIVEGTSEAIYVRDAEGRYVFANRAAKQLLGDSALDIAGKRDQEFFSEQSAAQIRASDLEVLRTNQPLSLELSLQLRGEERVFLSRKVPYRSAGQKIHGVLGIAMDITERRRMEEQLRRAQRMEAIGTLAGGIAHDFNNLLTVITGYSQLLLGNTTHATAHPMIRNIDEAANKAASLTRQLLAFSRQQVLQPRVIDLSALVENNHKFLRRLIGEDIDFITKLAAPVPSVHADPGQVEQVLMNLVANARDAMPIGGRLTIETAPVHLDDVYSRAHMRAPPGDYVLLAVSDTGTGMDETTKARIFDPFFTTKPAGQGTGLGLATVYGIVKQSNGYIWVYSEVGRGTTFKIYLPVVRAEAAASVVPVSSNAIRGTETILVVEDETALLTLVVTSLEKSGYTVIAAASVQEAEALAQTHSGSIDLVLSDVVMPKASGREGVLRITSLHPAAKVLWMSGYPDETITHHGLLQPGVHFLQKPFTPAELAAKIRDVLEG
jgi:PAS domain S-box-containing protein